MLHMFADVATNGTYAMTVACLRIEETWNRYYKHKLICYFMSAASDRRVDIDAPDEERRIDS